MSEKTEICKEKFLYYAREYIKRPGIDEFLNWLEHESDFFEAPASTKFHSAYAGGLCEHSVNVYERLKNLYAAEKADTLTDEEEEKIALVALFHDVCKTNMYVVDYKNQKTYDLDAIARASRYEIKHDQQGDFVWERVPYYTIDDTKCYGHGECSVDILRDFFKLTEEERLAVRWHMGFSDVSFKGGSNTITGAFEKCPLAVMLHASDLMASYLDEAR